MKNIKTTKISRAHKMMMLDFSGVCKVRDQPKKSSELSQMYILFKKTEPEMHNKAYTVIVEGITNNEGDDEIICRKVSEIINSSLNFQKSEKIEELTKHFMSLDNKITKCAMDSVSREIKKAREEFKIIKIKIGNRKPKKINEIVCEQFPQLLELAQERINIMMIGPAGCGKTHIAKQIADALELDFASQSCSAGMSESQLTGWLLPISKSGSFEYVQSEFIRIYENGGVFLLDEMDAADPNVLIFINQALANGQFSLPQRYKNPTIKKHKDFIAISACNTFGGGADAMYHARNALDASTIDRFKIGMVAIDYSQAVENSLTDNKYLIGWVKAIREVINCHGMRKIMSTRVLKDSHSMIEGQGWSLKKVSNSYFLDWSPEEKAIMENSFPAAFNPVTEESSWG